MRDIVERLRDGNPIETAGGQKVGKMKPTPHEYQAADEIERLRDALNRIANPIATMQVDAERAGDKFDGHMAISLSNNPTYLQGIAVKALSSESERGKGNE